MQFLMRVNAALVCLWLGGLVVMATLIVGARMSDRIAAWNQRMGWRTLFAIAVTLGVVASVSQLFVSMVPGHGLIAVWFPSSLR
jgi:multisubunit Na+/H+ antiporter MnhF subunit